MRDKIDEIIHQGIETIKIKIMKHKTKLIVLAIYLSGCFCSYLSGRAYIKQHKHWTQQDRAAVIVISSLSWISALSCGMCYLLDSFDNNKPANW